VLLTYEGRAVARLGTVSEERESWSQKTTEERRRLIRDIVAKMPPKPKNWPGAARSQDFLYDDDGLPA
jgi:antitoxin (DNA-binding transcriptional repressor) of toxin-antitoxin stability system